MKCSSIVIIWHLHGILVRFNTKQSIRTWCDWGRVERKWWLFTVSLSKSHVHTFRPTYKRTYYYQRQQLHNIRISDIEYISDISICDSKIQVSSVEKLLGVTISNTLCWDAHIEQLIKKCNSYLFLLSIIKVFLSRRNRILFYNSYNFTSSSFMLYYLG